MTSSLTRPLAPALLAAALALSACSSEKPAAFVDTPSTSQAAEAPVEGDGSADAEGGTGDTSAETQNAEEESAAAAGVNLSDVSDPVVTATVPAVVAGDPKATMDISLLSLSRDGQTLVGLFSFTVNSSMVDETDNLYSYLGGKSWSPYLVDTANLTRYDVLSNESGSIAAVTDSISSVRFHPGQTSFGYAAFAVPPEDVTSMTVNLMDGAPAAVNVPIQ